MTMLQRFTIVAIATAGLSASAHAQLAITSSTIDGGGGYSGGNGFELEGTIGQADAGLLTGGGFELNGGFWAGTVCGDADLDGLCDSVDACPHDTDNDADGDGVCGDVDQCPGFDDTLDADLDGVPDDCDPCPSSNPDDTDGDGVCESADICAGFDDNIDADGDGVPDGCDACTGNDASGDSDADNVCDSDDVCPGFDDMVDEDNNGTPDGCDVVPCVTHGDCADGDDDGIRDDGCVFWACEAGECIETDISYADMGGPHGDCQVDGTADGNDRFHALNCFSNQTPRGGFGYPCEAEAPAAYNVDAAGLGAPCSPDGVCDGNDAFAALNAFSGNTSCSCNGTPAPLTSAEPAIVDEVALLLIPSVNRAAVGDTVEVDVYITGGARDLRGYQLHAAASPELELIDMFVTDRRDHAFARIGYWDAYNLENRQMLAGIDAEGVSMKGNVYLATLVFAIRSTKNDDTLMVDLLHDPADPTQRTVLFGTPAGSTLEIVNTVPAVISTTRADATPRNTGADDPGVPGRES